MGVALPHVGTDAHAGRLGGLVQVTATITAATALVTAVGGVVGTVYAILRLARHEQTPAAQAHPVLPPPPRMMP